MRLFALTVIASSLMACSSTTPPDPAKTCNYRLRDLTVNWYERNYWCVPEGKAPVSSPRIHNRQGE
ncbi:Uncharacterised protein [Cardiobacterium valvarum]|uniref:Type IV conjugative transfer system protein TraV n=1 Tax=Cardiobacterium valvarum TaxID=194702 RepID=A0A381E8A6_9GAMM|nr:Uncharacterised protein [Cardiobacterium valvarum]